MKSLSIGCQPLAQNVACTVGWSAENISAFLAFSANRLTSPIFESRLTSLETTVHNGEMACCFFHYALPGMLWPSTSQVTPSMLSSIHTDVVSHKKVAVKSQWF